MKPDGIATDDAADVLLAEDAITGLREALAGSLYQMAASTKRWTTSPRNEAAKAFMPTLDSTEVPALGLNNVL